jgi:UDP-N-acetylglucosamine acyltransferase
MISEQSVIHPGAVLGKDVTVEPFTTIYGNVEIGDGSHIGPNVTIYEGAKIGKNCRIFPGAVISAVPQDLKYKGEDTVTLIGDNTIIRECVTINKGTVAAGKTVVGSNCLLMAYVHVAHDCIVGDHVILANGVTLAGHIEIHDHAIIGGLSAVHQFVKIGGHVMISGGSLIRKDVPPYIVAAREPLTFSGINTVGLRRRGYSNDQITLIQDIYRVLFNKGLSTSKAVDEIKSAFSEGPERDFILDFISRSDRGLLKGYTPGAEDN